jgi:crotonobetainyl-CoA:carnitine CoA-transferase CaiB-like acyl-CoA transferase
MGEDPWELVRREVGAGRVDELENRAVLLDLPVARLPDADGPTPTEPVPFLLTAPSGGRGRTTRPLVVDLSSMWAGPLCANLLGLAGGRVVKVESATRPDGARSGSPSFFRLLHGGHESVVLALAATNGRKALRRLVAAADVVIDSSRPRAMEQLGIDPLEVVAGGTTWVSVTAYGRGGRWSNRIGFGDDVAVAAGLVAGRDGAPLMCGDAAADPIAGLHAAVAAAGSLLSGRSRLVDVSLRDAVTATLGGGRKRELLASPADGEWVLNTEGGRVPVAPPRSRTAVAPARPFGADTAAVLAELGQ